MNELEAQLRIAVLREQRNEALDVIVILNAQLAMLRKELEEAKSAATATATSEAST